MKLFKISDIHVVAECQELFGFDLPSVHYLCGRTLVALVEEPVRRRPVWSIYATVCLTVHLPPRLSPLQPAALPCQQHSTAVSLPDVRVCRMHDVMLHS